MKILLQQKMKKEVKANLFWTVLVNTTRNIRIYIFKTYTARWGVTLVPSTNLKLLKEQVRDVFTGGVKLKHLSSCSVKPIY